MDGDEQAREFEREAWLTPSQAARRLGCSANWVKELADRGDLRSISTPLGRLIDAGDVDRRARDRAEKR